MSMIDSRTFGLTALQIEAALLRRAVPEDANAIRCLVRAAYAKWVPLIGREPEPMGVDYDLAVRRHVIDLVHADDRLLALIGMVPRPNHLLIGNVAVHPQLQHRGLGRRLLRHAEDFAVMLGLSELQLYTNARFESNLKLYESLGYRSIRDDPLPDGGLRVHMRKEL